MLKFNALEQHRITYSLLTRRSKNNYAASHLWTPWEQQHQIKWKLFYSTPVPSLQLSYLTFVYISFLVLFYSLNIYFRVGCTSFQQLCSCQESFAELLRKSTLVSALLLVYLVLKYIYICTRSKAICQRKTI